MKRLLMIAALLGGCATSTGPQQVGNGEYFLSVFRDGFSGGTSTAMPAALNEMAQHCSSLGGAPSASQIHQERGPCVFCMSVQIKYRCDGTPSTTVITSGGDTSGAATVAGAIGSSVAAPRPVPQPQPRLQTTCQVIGNTVYCR